MASNVVKLNWHSTYIFGSRKRREQHVYASFFKPYVAKHETEIDCNLMDLRTRAGDMAVLYCQKAVSYGQTRVFEVLQYVASQSTPTTRPPQNQAQQQAAGAARQPASASNHQAPKPKPQVEEPPSPTSSTSSSQQQKEIEQERSSSPAPSAAAPAPPLVHTSPRRLKSAPANSTQLTKTVQLSDPASSNHSAIKKTTLEPCDTADQSTKAVDEMQIDSVPSQQDKANSAPPPQETVLEEAIRFTRARLRKARSTAK